MWFQRHHQTIKIKRVDWYLVYYRAPVCPFSLQTFIPANVEPLLRLSFERIGRLKYKDGLNLQTPKVGWFALVGSTLHAYLEDSQGEEIHLRKLQELCELDTMIKIHLQKYIHMHKLHMYCMHPLTFQCDKVLKVIIQRLIVCKSQIQNQDISCTLKCIHIMTLLSYYEWFILYKRMVPLNNVITLYCVSQLSSKTMCWCWWRKAGKKWGVRVVVD